MKKKSKLFGLFSISLVFAVTLVFFHIQKNGTLIYESFKEKQMTILKNSMYVYIECSRERLESDFNSIYSRIDNGSLDKNQVLTIWKDLKNRNSFISGINFRGKDKYRLKNAADSFVEIKFSDNLTNELNETNLRNIIWTSAYIDKESQNFTVPLSKGVWDNEGNFTGILTVDFILNSFNEKLNKMIFPKNTILLLLNENSELIGYNTKNPIFKTYKKQEWYNEVKDNSEGHLKSRNNYITFCSNEKSNWKFISITPVSSVESYSKEINISILLIIAVSLLTLFITYELIILTINKRNKEIITSIRHLRETNHHDIDIHLKKLIKKDNLYNEVYDEILKLTSVEKNLYKDIDTGLYNKEYLNLNNAKWTDNQYDMLVLKYQNLQEIRNIYGKGIVDLVVKRGSLTFKSACAEDEFGIRFKYDTLCLLIKKDDSRKKSEKIIKEITNYKWKLSNLKAKMKFHLIENFNLEKIKEIDSL